MASMSVNNVDTECIISLSPVNNNGNSVEENNLLLEREIIYNLISQNSGFNILNNIDGNNNYTNPKTENTLNVGIIDQITRQQFSLNISSNIISSGDSYAFISQYRPSEHSVRDSSTFNIGTNSSSQPKTIRVSDPTESLYNSHLKVSTSDNNGPFGLDSGNYTLTSPENQDASPSDFSVSFDSNSETCNFIKALNSQFNTQENLNPLYLEEFYEFNTSKAFGLDLSKYYTLINTTNCQGESIYGKPTDNWLDDNYILSNNSFNLNVDVSNFSFCHQGSYRLQFAGDIPIVNLQYSSNVNDYSSDINNYPSTKTLNTCISNNQGYYERIQDSLGLNINSTGPIGITEYNGMYVDTNGNPVYNSSYNGVQHSPNNIVSKYPVFNSTLGTSGSNSLPTELSLNDWYSLFNLNNNTVLSDYVFKMTITENPKSGYALSSDMLTLSNSILRLDSGNLVDNEVYMEQFVNGTHTLSFNNATLSITSTELFASNNESLFSLTTGRETLPSNLAGQNGQILLNINSPNSRVRVIVDQQNQLTATVIYNDEDDGNLNRVGIRSELQHNHYVKYSTELIFKNPSTKSGSFLTDGNASLDLLYNNTVVNSSFDTDYFSFSELASSNSDIIKLLKINSQQQLTNINGLYENNANLLETFILTNAYLSNLKTISSSNGNMFGQFINSAKVLLNLHETNYLSVNDAIANSGWTLTNPNPILYTSSHMAFAPDGFAWPTYDETIALLDGTYPSIDYNIKVVVGTSVGSTTTGSNEYGSQLFNSLVISWGKNSNYIIVPQENLTITSSISPNTVTSIVDPSFYNVNTSGSSPLARKQFKLVKYTVTKSFQYVTLLDLRPYDALTITTPNITQTIVYYNLVDLNTNAVYPKSYWNWISVNTSTPNNPFTGFKKVTQTIVPTNRNESLSFNGTLVQSDLQDLSAIVNGYDDNNTATPLTTVYGVSSFYGVPVTMELLNQYEAVTSVMGDISLSLSFDYSGSSSLDTSNANVLLNSGNGYYINLETSNQTNYTVSYMGLSLENISDPSFTNLVSTNSSNINTNYIDISNVYSNIVAPWDTSSYKVEVTYSSSPNTNDNSITVLNIINVASNAIEYQISTMDYKYISTQMIISSGASDIYRLNKWIGADVNSNTWSEEFITVDYNPGSGYGYFQIDDGVYIDKDHGSCTLDLSTIQNIGNTFAFELKQDSISVNMVGLANTRLQPIDNLEYQYVNGNHVSRILTVDRYRGYYGQQNHNQTYTLVRNELVATFTVSNCEDTVSQTFNVYAGSVFNVNNLLYNSNNSPLGNGNIGLAINLNFSMLDEDDQTSFPIYVLGDNVVINVVNPNVCTFSPINLNLTLKQYSLFSFSGSNFASTNGPLNINSSRLKIRRSDFQNSVAVYELNLYSGISNLYMNSCYLGNPANLDNEDLVATSYNNSWGSQVASYNYSQLLNGINRNSLYLQRQRDTNIFPSISFFVQAPPYIYVNQRYNNVYESMPYSVLSNLSNNVKSYVPVTGTQNVAYNPFAPSTTYDYIDGGSFTVTFDNVKTNNITVNQYVSREAPSYYNDPHNYKRYFFVEGNNITIDLNLGLKTDSNTSLITTLISETPANRLLNFTNNTSIFSLYQASDYNSGVTMKLYQPPGGTYSNMSTVDTSGVFNALFQIENFFFTNLNSVQFNLPTEAGQSIYLYTTNTVFDNAGNASINVYKYVPSSSFNYNQNVALKRAVYVFLYGSRLKQTFQLPQLTVQQNHITTWYDILNSINPSIVTNNWTPDNTFTGPASLSLVNYTVNAAGNVPVRLFNSPANGTYNVTFVSNQPVLTIYNKNGTPKFQICSNGTLVTPFVSTNSLILNTFVQNNAPSTSTTNNGTVLPNYLQISSSLANAVNTN
jgi:hypothetical protein